MTDITMDRIFVVGFKAGWENAVAFWRHSNEKLIRENTIMREALISIEAGNPKRWDAGPCEIRAGEALDALKGVQNEPEV